MIKYYHAIGNLRRTMSLDTNHHYRSSVVMQVVIAAGWAWYEGPTRRANTSTRNTECDEEDK